MSTQLAKVIREEIARLSKKEVRSNLTKLKEQVAHLRSDNAKLKKEVKSLQKALHSINKSQLQQTKASENSSGQKEGTRFSPTWVKSHRKRLGLSASSFGKLLGVHQLTVYKWENGETKPRRSQLSRLAEVRGIGKKEALKRLAELGEDALPKRRGRPPKNQKKKATQRKTSSK